MSTYLKQLLQIFDGPIWDGYLISKSNRDKLKQDGFIEQENGWNTITIAGIEYVLQNKLRINR